MCKRNIAGSLSIIAKRSIMPQTVSWTPDQAAPPHLVKAPMGGAEKYHGPVAENYDAKREETPKWQAEQRIVEDMLSDLPSGSWVLDCPVGTGRFLQFYAGKGFIVRAMDLSSDMLDKARKKGNAA